MIDIQHGREKEVMQSGTDHQSATLPEPTRRQMLQRTLLSLLGVSVLSACGSEQNDPSRYGSARFIGLTAASPKSFRDIHDVPLAVLIDRAKVGALDTHEFDLCDVLLRISQDLGEKEASAPLTVEQADAIKQKVFSMAANMLSRLQADEQTQGRTLTPMEQMQAIRAVFFDSGKIFQFPDVMDLLEQQEQGRITTFDQSWETGIGVCEDQTGNLLSVIHALERTGVDLPIYPVTCPNHIFVGWVDGEAEIYLELTQAGEIRTRDDYLKSFGLDPELKTNYLRPEPLEVVATELNNCGIGLLTQGKIEDAIEYWELAIGLIPADPGLLAGRASCFACLAYRTAGAEREAWAERAISDLDNAVELDPNNRNAVNIKVKVLRFLANNEEEKDQSLAYLDRAILSLDQALRTRHRPDPLAALVDWTEDSSLIMGKAALYEERFLVSKNPRDMESAITIFQTEEETSDSPSSVLAARIGSAYLSMYRELGGEEFLQSAIREYERSAKIARQSKGYELDARQYLAIAHHEAGNYDTALGHWNFVLQNGSQFERTRAYLGRALTHYELGSLQKAAQDMRRFVEQSSWQSFRSFQEIVAHEDHELQQEAFKGEIGLWKFTRPEMMRIFEDHEYRELLESELAK